MALRPGAFSAIDLFAQLTGLRDYGAGPSGEMKSKTRYASGTGDRQAENLFFDERTLVGGASETLDLTTILNGNDQALGAAEVAVFGIQTNATNPAGVRMDDSPANPWTAFLSSSGATDDAQLDFPPGVTMAFDAPLDGSYAVNAGSRAFQMTNLDGGTDAIYRIFILTRDS